MEQVFSDTRALDKIARKAFNLSEDIMMENAAAALEKECFFEQEKNYINRPAALILAGSGNNGADGYALARRLQSHELSVTVCQVLEPKSQMCIIQAERTKKTGVQFIDIYSLDSYIEEKSFDLKIICDCIFGSGFHGTLPPEAAAAIQEVNKIDSARKIACDIPSGLKFNADITVTMGALKTCLFGDEAKDICGKIIVADLGISRAVFEGAGTVIQSADMKAAEYTEEAGCSKEFGCLQEAGCSEALSPEAYLLNESDLILPTRKLNCVHKGTFGHVAVIAGEKNGAALIAGTAALNFGCGLVSVVASQKDAPAQNHFQNNFCSSIPPELMSADSIPENANTLILGPGLGRNTEQGIQFINFLLQNPNVSAVLDADIFYYKEITELLKNASDNSDKISSRNSGGSIKQKLILTPHPKEFSSLLEICGLGKYSVQEIVSNRIELVKKFCEAFPNTTLILKGANVLIASKMLQNNQRIAESRFQTGTQIFINQFGTNALSKAGSGDVLSGLCAALLAQNQEPLRAAINASLCHALASRKIKNNFALTPFKLIEQISNFEI